MAGQESRHLRRLVGKRVEALLDDGRRAGVLTELRRSGPRVRFDGEERDRTVAAWRLGGEPGSDR
jgi:hypothetical protein